MVQLRTAIRAYALEGHLPSDILVRLNRLLLEFYPGVIATVCYAVYDRRDGRFTLGNAGHIPPLILSAAPRFLPYGGALLGIDAGAVTERSFVLEEGDAILFFTDGLVERRGESLDAGLDRLAQSASGSAETLRELCDASCATLRRALWPTT